MAQAGMERGYCRRCADDPDLDAFRAAYGTFPAADAVPSVVPAVTRTTQRRGDHDRQRTGHADRARQVDGLEADRPQRCPDHAAGEGVARHVAANAAALRWPVRRGRPVDAGRLA